MTNNFPQPERVLVIVAHPDDPEFGAAGTVALWASQGAKVTYVIVTDGSKGSADRHSECQQQQQRNNYQSVHGTSLLSTARPEGGPARHDPGCSSGTTIHMMRYTRRPGNPIDAIDSNT